MTGEEEGGERCFLQITTRFICQETKGQYKPFPTTSSSSSSLATSRPPCFVKVRQF